MTTQNANTARQIKDLPIEEAIVALACSGADGEKIVKTLVYYFGAEQSLAAHRAMASVDRTGMKTQRDLVEAVRAAMSGANLVSRPLAGA